MLQWYLVTIYWRDDSLRLRCRHVDGVCCQSLSHAESEAIGRDHSLELSTNTRSMGVQNCYTKEMRKMAIRLHNINNETFVGEWSRTDFVDFMCMPAYEVH
jgi:hypothetical protein